MNEIDCVAALTERQKGHLPDHMNLKWLEARPGFMRGRIMAELHHMAPNGYLHAGTVVTLADSACGYGCVISKPDAAIGFTTIELKTNFLGAAQPGETIVCEARLAHGGRTTQVWDAEVRNETNAKAMALFRCTQMLLYGSK
jgi:1,4-dihydroxy-2-naphthoyl-CoA hydrolase